MDSRLVVLSQKHQDSIFACNGTMSDAILTANKSRKGNVVKVNMIIYSKACMSLNPTPQPDK